MRFWSDRILNTETSKKENLWDYRNRVLQVYYKGLGMAIKKHILPFILSKEKIRIDGEMTTIKSYNTFSVNAMIK